MQVVKRTIVKEDDDMQGSGRRLSALSMYQKPPQENLSLPEFEEFAFDRLRRAFSPITNPSAHPTCAPVPLVTFC